MAELTADQKLAMERLLKIAQRDTGQSKKVADFLLAWHSASENGGWDPTDLWAVDRQIAADMITAIITLWSHHGKYLNDLGYREEIEAIWTAWRAKP